ncbi:Myotubularin-related protein [Seminavis robusta]|uniref:Myotubularin-related protein n=1 Tax=Seminavis robusta TaxID=568900 RepID=A0A9N8EZ61_9STRA|nr:Myotubularin-related protein [Seminavis robusta]|eukprot:Sro2378_g325370.1 Myotubularin-related protein (640) ;mRNA; f:3-1922
MHVMNSANNGATAPGAERPTLLQHPFTAPQSWNASCWPPAFATVMEVPLASMEKVEKTVYTAAAVQGASPHHPGRPTSLMGLQVWAKEGRVWRITTPSYADTLRAHQALLTYAFPGRRNLGYLFAFESKRAAVVNSVVTDPATGQKTVSLALTRRRFDALVEFQRQFNSRGASPVQPWKIWTQINSQYQLCMSYPNVLVGPASLDEHNPDAVRLLQACAGFRSEQRLPALAWGSGIDGASIWRCSQPKIGLQGNRSSADELVLKHIMEAAKSANALREQPLPVRMDAHLLQVFTGASGQDLANTHWVKESNCALKILDLRPRSAAMANRTGGYGYENTSNYPGTTLQFCNIGNIHAVRDAYQKLTALCLNMSNASDINWGSALEDTKWLSHIRIILAAAWETAFWVQVHRMPVLLHCSHGWDRTSQVSALAQLMLDPYYRTLEGFACLMEKDFMSLGHPFHTRCAHGEGKGGAEGGGGVHHQDGSGKGPAAVGNSSAPDEGQISPVFLQFLDCVWQIVQQFPECFEFTTTYILELSDHIYSCRFGNMLCDTERERELVAGIRQRTYSVWDHLEQDPNDPNSDPEAKLWRNPHYDPSPTAGGGVLLMPMSTLLRNVTLWRERHARSGPKATKRWRNTFTS